MTNLTTSLAMRAVRDEVAARRVPRRAMNVLGYWKHDATNEW